jgi:hypothetical protein
VVGLSDTRDVAIEEGSNPMIRQFQFEAEIYDSLSCVPMAARRKLDRLGIKIGLQQWRQLGRGERLMICHAPAENVDECGALRLFIEEATILHSGTPPRELDDEVRRSALPPATPPSIVVHNAAAAGVTITQKEWDRLDDDQRYALIKLGGVDKPSHNFKAALAELITVDGRSVEARG